jgi:hypothetical protein
MDLAGWLRSVGLERYEAAFRENAIDATVLPNLRAEDLKELGVGIVGHLPWKAKAMRTLVHVFDDMAKPIGLMRFAPHRAAKGSLFTARQRAAATNIAGFADRPAPAPVVTESDLGKLPELLGRKD